MISTEEYLRYCDTALDQYAAVCRGLGDDLVNARLDDVPGSNSAFALVTHVVGVMAFWGRTTNRGIVVPRDRDAEFTAAGTMDDALDLLARGWAALHEDVHAAAARELPANPPDGEDGEDVGTQGAVLFHIYEELAQHLGQLEVTRDVLLARRG